MAGSIELAGNQFGMPTKDSIRFDDRRNGLQHLSSELLTDCGKLSPFFVLESKLTFYFRSKDTVLGDKILIAKPESLIDGAGDIGK